MFTNINKHIKMSIRTYFLNYKEFNYNSNNLLILYCYITFYFILILLSDNLPDV